MDTLDQFRKKIDSIDDQLATLLVERFLLTEQIGLYKKMHNIPILNMKREQSMREKRATRFEAIAQEEYIVEVFETILKESKRQQVRLHEETT